MRFLFLLIATSAGSVAPVARALAHAVIGGEENSGNWLFWVYGLVIAAIAGIIIYRKWRAARETPERLAQKSRLRDFERDHAMCMSQLKNAENYPKECGLTQAERQDRIQSAAAMQKNIDKIKAYLAES